MTAPQQHRSEARRPWWVRAAGLLLALHIFVAVALEFVPELHSEVHENAGTDSHICLVTILQGGAVDLALVSIAFVGLALVCFGLTVAAPEFHLPLVAHRLLPGRAPPASA